MSFRPAPIGCPRSAPGTFLYTIPLMLGLLLLVPEVASGQPLTARRAGRDTLGVRYELDPLLVTAFKIPQVQSRLPFSITLLEGDDLRSMPNGSVLELAGRHVPGLYVNQWGAMGMGIAGQSAGKLTMRGLGGGANTHVLILRNGRPDFMGVMGCTAADEFTLDGVERIEIVRGPGSFLYGTNATGGIINIISRAAPGQGMRTSLEAGAGHFGIRTGRLNHGGRVGPIGYLVTASSRQADGHRPESGYRSHNGTLRLDAPLAAGTDLAVSAQWADIRLLDPGIVSDPGVPTDNRYDLTRWGTDATLTHQGDAWEGTLKVHGNFGEHDFSSGWRSSDRLLGVMGHVTLNPGSITTVTAGFDLKRYGGRARESGFDHGTFYVHEYAPYVMGHRLIGGRLALTGGVRMEFHQRYGRRLLPMGGMVLHIAEGTNLRVSAARGLRSPSLREMEMWAPANPELDPDLFWSREVGIAHQFGERWKVDAVLFRLEGSDLIEYLPPPAGGPRWVNTGSLRSQGLEVVVHGLPTPKLSLDASFSRVLTDRRVHHSPGSKLTLSGTWRLDRVTLSGSLLAVHDLWGAEWGPSPVPTRHRLDNFQVIDLAARTGVLEAVALTVSLRNALDAAYDAMWGYPMPGRHLMMELGYRLDHGR